MCQVPKELEAGTIEFEGVKFFYPFRPEVGLEGSGISWSKVGTSPFVYRGPRALIR